MKYHDVAEGVFLERPNRFIAYVRVGDSVEKVHVKNTGRCRELLTKEAAVYLEKNDSKTRSTAYDLVAVKKGGRLINMDSQAPNRAVEEWLKKKILFPDLLKVRPETKYGNSRFDFYLEAGDRKIFMEVKGVTLEEDNKVLFPDAPSMRALKHVEELIEAKKAGYEAYILFVIQMKDVAFFTPNEKMQPAFAEALRKAKAAGVNILAFDCRVGKDFMEIEDPVEVRLFDVPEKKDNHKNEENLNFTLGDIPKPLLKWYDDKRRVLPWREEPTPYRVWVSEIMLQQTRVEAVKPYFERFMAALPDIKSLSEAPEEVLLKLWEGLGYYNRVRNLKKAAVQIMEEYGGQMPASYEELLRLKGIGSYTAGAIASIAFGLPVPAVDGNVMRVISRLFMCREDIAQPRVKKEMEQELLTAMPKRAGDFNQAMMEIGAMVCIPNGAPHCEKCPLKDMCLSRKNSCQSAFPVKEKKKSRSVEKLTVFILQDAEKTAIHKRPEKGLLAGLYEFPNAQGHLSQDQVRRLFKEKGLSILKLERLTDAVHIFTHKEWHMWGYRIRVDELTDHSEVAKNEGWIFENSARVQEKYPMPSAFAVYAECVNIKSGKKGREKL